MQTKDVMYVANAKVVDYYKLLTLINNTANTTVQHGKCGHQREHGRQDEVVGPGVAFPFTTL